MSGIQGWKARERRESERGWSVLSKRKKEKVNKTKIIIKININNKYK
jgi:hypothetical protein